MNIHYLIVLSFVSGLLMMFSCKSRDVGTTCLVVTPKMCQSQGSVMNQFDETLKSYLVGPYNINNRSPAEVVGFLVRTINDDLSEHGYKFGISAGCYWDSKGLETNRVTFAIQRMPIQAVLGFAAQQLGCTVTNMDGFFRFSHMNPVIRGSKLQ